MSNRFFFSKIPATSNQIVEYENQQENTFGMHEMSLQHERSLQQQNYFSDFPAFGLQENIPMNEILLQQQARVPHIWAIGNNHAYRNPSMHRVGPPSFGTFIRSLAVRPELRIHKPRYSMVHQYRYGNREHQPSFFMYPLPNQFVVNQRPVYCITKPQPTTEIMGFGNHRGNNNTSYLPGGSGYGTQKHEPEELDLTLKL